MAKYIDAEKIPYYLVDSDDTNTKAEGIRVAFKNEIDKMPAADVQEVKHGKWGINILTGNPTCNQCGHAVYQVDISLLMDSYLFCPHCGAKMDGKDGEQNDA